MQSGQDLTELCLSSKKRISIFLKTLLGQELKAKSPIPTRVSGKEAITKVSHAPKALSDIKEHVINISTLMANKALKENMSAKIDDKIFEDTLKEIGEVSWQN